MITNELSREYLPEFMLFYVSFLIVLQVYKTPVHQGLHLGKGIKDIDVICSDSLLKMVIIVSPNARWAQGHKAIP